MPGRWTSGTVEAEFPTWLVQGEVGLAVLVADGLELLWGRDPEAAFDRLAEVDRRVQACLTATEGYGVRLTEGSIKAAFPDSSAAIRFCREAQQALLGVTPLPPRAAVGVGAVHVRADPIGGRADPTGPAVAALLEQVHDVPMGRIGGPDGLLSPTAGLGVPPERTSFHGRTLLVAELVSRLADPGVTVLVGPGGAGKTRTACRAATAAHAASPPPGGTWFVDMSAATALDDVWSALASTLGVEAAHVTADLAARGRTVLVLDNLEQLAAHGEALRSWWRDLPALTVLATSRVSLGEHEIRLGALPGDEAMALLEARAPGWTRRDPDAASQLVAALDGLPLGLELAAARADLFGPAEVLTRLRALPRLRDVVAWSRDLLDAGDAAALAHLSVFGGAFTVAEAEQVVGPTAADRIARLRDASLLRPVGSEPTWALYETVRRVALDDLRASGEEEEVRARHAEVLVGDPSSWWGGPRDETRPRQLAWIERHQADLRACLSRGGATAALAALRLEPWCDVRLPTDARLAVLDAGLAAAVDAGDPVVEARIRGRRVLVFQARGPLASAREDLDRALATARERGLRDLEGRMLLHDAILGFLEDEMAQVEPRLQEVLRLAAALGDDALRGGGLACLALMRENAGDLEQAEALFERALSILETTDDALTTATVSMQASTLYLGRGRPDDATRLARRAVEAFERLDHPRQLAIAKKALARALAAAGDASSALAMLLDELHRVRRHGGGLGEAFLLCDVAGAQAALGRPHEAVASLTDALALLDGAGMDHANVPVMHGMALLASGRAVDARAALAPVLERIAVARWVDAAAAAVSGDLEGARAALDASPSDEPDLCRAIAEGLLALAEERPDLAGAALRRAEAAPRSDAWAVAMLRLLSEALRRWRAAHAAPLRMSPDGAEVVLPSGERIDLSRRGPPRRIAAFLYAQRLAAPGDAQSLEAVLAAGWPGERVLPQAATNRVYVAIATLRKAGLGDVLLTREDGYLLDPELPVITPPSRR